MFHPNSPFHAVCADIVLVNPPVWFNNIHTKYQQKEGISTDANVLKEISIGNSK